MADLPNDGLITTNGDYDVVLQSPHTEVIIVGDTSGSNNGFDGGTIDIKAVHPLDGTDEVNGDALAAPTSATGITSDFTDIYKGQKGRKLRFTLSGAGGNTAIRIHTGATTSG